MACAFLRDGTYHIDSPAKVGDPEGLLKRLGEAAPQETVVAGFDFPIGLPRAYAKRAGVERFREFLADLAWGHHNEFWHPATQPGEISSARPFFPGGSAKGKRKNMFSATFDDGSGHEILVMMFPRETRVTSCFNFHEGDAILLRYNFDPQGPQERRAVMMKPGTAPCKLSVIEIKRI